MRSEHWVTLTLGRALHFVTGIRKRFFLTSVSGGSSKVTCLSTSLSREKAFQHLAGSPKTELRPELVGHLHTLLCREHSTLLSHTGLALWVCWHWCCRAALVTHVHGNPLLFSEHGHGEGSSALSWHAGPWFKCSL